MTPARAYRCQCRLTDVHTHVVPGRFPPYVGTSPGARWPSMAPADGCHRHVMIDGSIYRTVSDACWDATVRIGDMDRLAVDRHVLSPMPELLSYWMTPIDARAMCRFLNETIAEFVALAPERFAGLGAVPLQDVDAAIAELEHLTGTLGLAGVEIGTNVGDRPIGDPHFEPFFAAAARLGAAIFVHPLRPAGMDRLVGPAQLEQVLAFPGEIGLAAASLITGGTLARHPDLRIACSHGGGALAILLPRLRHAWRLVGPLQKAIPTDPAELARRLYVDELVYDEATIRHLIAVFGVDRVMIGSDYPFVIMDGDPRRRLDALGLDDTAAALLADGNARRWLFGPAADLS